MGLLLVWDSGSKLLHREHVAIGNVTLLGHDLWLGYLMLGALTLSGAWPIVVSLYPEEGGAHDLR